jgi:hypothetical protein
VSDVRLRFHGAPPAYTFIGDSHAGIFDGLIFADREVPDRFVMTKSRWQPYFRAAKFFAGGRFPERITRTFLDVNLITAAPAGEGWPIFTPITTESESGGELAEACRPRERARVCVFCCGDVDAREATHAVPHDADFPLEPDVPGLARLPRHAIRQFLPLGAVEQMLVDRYLGPLFDGLAALREAGYTRLFLHSLPPPIDLDAPHKPPVLLRYKVSIAMNRLMERFCERTGIGFLSIWDAVTNDDLIAPRFDLDGVHLNLDAATVTVDRLDAAVRRLDGMKDPAPA